VAGAICLLLAFCFFAGVADQSQPDSRCCCWVWRCWSAKHFFPSFGVLGIGGIVSLALGSLFALRYGRFLILVSIARSSLPPWRRSAASFWLLVYLVFSLAKGQTDFRQGRSHRRDRPKRATKLAPTGRIFVHGEHWGRGKRTALSRAAKKVRVIGYDGMRLKVTRVAEGGAKKLGGGRYVWIRCPPQHFWSSSSH